ISFITSCSIVSRTSQCWACSMDTGSATSQFLFRPPHHLWIEQEHTARPLAPEDQPHRNYGVKLFHSRQRIEKSRAFIAQPPSVTIQQHRIKTLVIVIARRI